MLIAAVQLSRRASKDAAKLSSTERARVAAALDDLAAGVQNLDVKPLVNRDPYLRLRVGELRVIYRLIDEDALSVVAIVNRRELKRIPDSL